MLKISLSLPPPAPFSTVDKAEVIKGIQSLYVHWLLVASGLTLDIRIQDLLHMEHF